MLRLNRLLFSSSESDVFIDRITPTLDQRSTLVDAKNAIRDYLRPRIQRATVEVLGMEKSVPPRFRTQGSWAYATCVQPAWQPPQEMDWDFGVYLPVTVWEEGGPPSKMAPLYFKVVEDLLVDLCKAKGWKLYSGKDTCIRVQVNSSCHIDLPLYAAPEREFVRIAERASSAVLAKSRSLREALAENIELGEMAEQDWEDLDHIVMATRKGEWKASDPEAVAKWYSDRVLEHTEQLQRVCMYLKAWRDLQWKSGGGPTSVCIMIAVAKEFEARRGRDDQALEAAAHALASALRGEIREVGIDGGAEDFNRLSEAERIAAADKAQYLADRLQSARTKDFDKRQEAVALVTSQLGTRVPDRADLLDLDGGAALVRSTPPEQVPHPVVKQTKAG